MPRKRALRQPTAHENVERRIDGVADRAAALLALELTWLELPSARLFPPNRRRPGVTPAA